MKILICALLFISSSAFAKTIIKGKMAPGLWEFHTKNLINGVDTMAQMKEMREKAIAKMKPEQQKIMREQLAKNPEDPSYHKSCLTAEDAAKNIDVEDFIQNQKKESKSPCQYKLVSATDTSANFTVTCDQKEFMGSGKGRWELINSKEWEYSYEGSSNMSYPGIGGKRTSGKTTVKAEIVGKWVASDCGKVPPSHHDSKG